MLPEEDRSGSEDEGVLMDRATRHRIKEFVHRNVKFYRTESTHVAQVGEARTESDDEPPALHPRFVPGGPNES